MMSPIVSYNNPSAKPYRLFAEKKRLTIIGLGNEFISDDGVGIYVVRQLQTKLQQISQPDADAVHDRYGAIIFEELAVGGLQLLDYIVGYDQCILVDAVVSGICPPGTIYRCELTPGTEPVRLSTSHQIDLLQVLKLAELLKANVPPAITVYGVEAFDVIRFNTKCTEYIEEAVPRLVELIYQSLVQHGSCTLARVVPFPLSNDLLMNWEIVESQSVLTP